MKHLSAPYSVFFAWALLLFFYTNAFAAVSSPADITGGNLKLWLDANDLDGDGNSSNNPTNGTAVSTWKDKSGNTSDAVQETDSRRPIYTAGGLNSLPVISFAGGGTLEHLVSNGEWSFLGNGTGSTVLMVVRSAMSDGGTDFILSAKGDTTTQRFQFLNYSNGGDFAEWISNSGNTDVVSKYLPPVSTQYEYNLHSILVKADTPVFQHFLNGGLLGDQRLFRAGSATGGGVSKLYIGGMDQLYYMLSGEVAELAIYNRVLSGSERKEVECYLETKWGLPVHSCPSTSPITLQSFTSSNANGSYGVGQVVTISANFSKQIEPGSVMTIQLDNGRSVALTTTFQSMLSGTYIPLVGDTSSDLTVSSIISATVTDLSGNNSTAFSVPASPNNLADSKNIAIESNLPQVPVIIIAGQSNALGRAPLSAISRTDGTPQTKIYGEYMSSFQTLLQGVNQQSDFPATQFGPEMGIAYTYKDENASSTSPSLYIIKYAAGNTFLKPFPGYDDWYPYNSDKLFDTLIQKSQSALNQIHAAGFTPKVLGLYWMQGENDATRSDYAAEYETNLTNFIAETRLRLGFPDLPVAIGRVRLTDIGSPQVRSAQAAVVATDSYACLLNFDDLILFDGVHFDAPSQMTIGNRVWDAFKHCGTASSTPVTSPPSPPPPTSTTTPSLPTFFENLTITGNLSLGTSLFSTLQTGLIKLGGSNFISAFGLPGSHNIFMGIGSGEMLDAFSTAVDSTCIGTNACKSVNTAARNTVVGSQALKSAEMAFDNSAFGYEALKSLTSSSNSNIAVGRGAGHEIVSGLQNVYLGAYAGTGQTGGNENIFVGYSASAGRSNLNNAIVIGANGKVEQENSIVLGNERTRTAGIGPSSPYAKLTVWGNGTGSGELFSLVNNASTTVFRVLDKGTVIFGAPGNPSCEQRYSMPSGNPVRVFFDDEGVQHSELGMCE